MKQNRITEVEDLHVSPPDAKPMLYEVPTYLRQSSIGNKNRKTKRKKRDGKFFK